MAVNADGDLHVFMVSVGQGDTTVIVSPLGNVIIIDAMRPEKILRLLSDLGNNGTVEHLVVTHPHDDHFGGCNRLAQDLTILEAAVAPFWHEFGMGPTTYRRLIGRLDDQNTKVTFLSGYCRWYPDGAMTNPPAGLDPEIDPDKPYLELLGPTNGLVQTLEQANVFETNHLSIMSRLTWRNFRMISAGDAQMENWAFFDHERMLQDKCQVLRTAHHGSCNGTQWERIDRLDPGQLIVSSDPESGHLLPDLSGTAIFATFNSAPDRIAVVTKYTGTIHLKVTQAGSRTLTMFGDSPTENIDRTKAAPLTEVSNPTDWKVLLNNRIQAM
jgi:competence protein ComEC